MTELATRRRVPIDVTADELDLICFALHLTAAVTEAEHRLVTGDPQAEPQLAREARGLHTRLNTDLERRRNMHSARQAARAAAREEARWDRL